MKCISKYYHPSHSGDRFFLLPLQACSGSSNDFYLAVQTIPVTVFIATGTHLKMRDDCSVKVDKFTWS